MAGPGIQPPMFLCHFLPFFSTSRDLCMHLIRHRSPPTNHPLYIVALNFFPILQQEGLVCMRVRTVYAFLFNLTPLSTLIPGGNQSQ